MQALSNKDFKIMEINEEFKPLNQLDLFGLTHMYV